MAVVASKYRGTTDYIRVLAELVHAAEYRGVTTYQDLAVIMGLPLRGSHMGKQTGQVLGEISRGRGKCRAADAQCGCRFSKREGRARIFALARDLGRFSGAAADEESFWRQELQAAYDTWKRPLHKP